MTNNSSKNNNSNLFSIKSVSNNKNDITDTNNNDNDITNNNNDNNNENKNNNNNDNFSKNNFLHLKLIILITMTQIKLTILLMMLMLLFTRKTPNKIIIQKNTVFILGNSIVKTLLNSFLLTKNSIINVLSRYDHLVQRK